MLLYTRQHKNVLQHILDDGRYVVTGEYVGTDMPEFRHIILDMYSWLADNLPNKKYKPADAKFPLWFHYNKDAVYLPTEDTVMITIEGNEEELANVNIFKWGMIQNYTYIPKDNEDNKRHLRMLEDYNTSDVQAYMSQFYPEIKREIRESWVRLFDKSIIIDGNPMEYALLWEIKKSQVVSYEV